MFPLLKQAGNGLVNSLISGHSKRWTPHLTISGQIYILRFSQILIKTLLNAETSNLRKVSMFDGFLEPKKWVIQIK